MAERIRGVKLNTFRMVGAWGWTEVCLYELLITPNMGPLYDEFAEDAKDNFSEGRMLEIGCGSGQAVVAFLKRYPDAEIVATDLSDVQIKKARKRLGSVGAENVTFQVEDACNLTFPDGSFDLVYSLASIKHWPDQDKGLREAYRVVKPGGSLMVLEVDREAPDEKIDRFINLWRAPFFLFPKQYFKRIVLPTGLTESEALEKAEKAGIHGAAVKKPDRWPFLYLDARK
jgi:ubiquinone/menaquinone biosynthesis C-methylase UbiE